MVREDLSFAQQIVQSCHSLLESVLFKPPNLYIPHPHLVLCSVSDEQELLIFAEKLNSRGIKFSLFQEPDIGNVYTSLSTEPISGETRRIFSKLRLLNREASNDNNRK